MVSKLSEIWSGVFIPDLDPDFLPIPDPGSRVQKGTVSRIQIPDPQHCILIKASYLPDCCLDKKMF
jgi:hypothetical protein